ncbi:MULTISPECIES: ABC transporter permease subunit [Peptostreptococcaceae]|uniref:ABC transporter permease subunit n=1 Tax=Peptostreptococcaceae TaxID=186804 RepID=UPI0022E3EFCE|nr:MULTISPECIES: ABC transporter permease subunit [Clostridia]
MRMFRLEIKRILKMKQTIILIGIGLILSVVMAYLPISYESINYIDSNGKEVRANGMDAIKYKKSIREKSEGIVTTDKVYSALETYQSVVNQYKSDESKVPLDIYTEKISPIRPLISRVPEIYVDSNTGIGKGLVDIQLDNINDYYKDSEQHLKDLMKLEYPKNTDAQNKAIKMYEKVEKPFQIYGGFSRDAFDYIGLYILLLLIICTAIAAPTFSEGYQNGSDSIFRCTKNGRFDMAVTKITAVFTIAVILFIVCISVQVSILNFAFGTESLKTSVQMLFSGISLVPYNLGELQIAIAISGLISVLSTMSFSIFVSSKCRTSVATLLISIVVCFMPIILYSTKGNSLISYLFPSSGIGLANSMLYQLTSLNFVNVGGISVWSPYIIIIASLFELVLFSILAVRNYCKHQVI